MFLFIGQTQHGARSPLIKSGTTAALVSKGAVTRAIVADSEMAAFFKRQQQQKVANATAATIQGAINQQQTVQIGAATTAQLLAQAGLQVNLSELRKYKQIERILTWEVQFKIRYPLKKLVRRTIKLFRWNKLSVIILYFCSLVLID